MIKINQLDTMELQWNGVYKFKVYKELTFKVLGLRIFSVLWEVPVK